MSYKKLSNLSSRSKRRRVEDELRNIASFISDPVNDHNVSPGSNSSKINFVPAGNSKVCVSTSIISNENANFIPPQRSSNESIFQDYSSNEALDFLSEISISGNSESESSSNEHNNDCKSNNYKYVEFLDDKTVEAVPNYWFKNQKCAWPKKNTKQMIQKRVYPNVLDFNFFAARKMGKDIESYSIASQKAMKALYTSDLSTNESSSQINEFENTCTNKKTKRKITLKEKKTENLLLWSPASCDVLNDEIDDSDVDPNYSPRYKENITHGTPTKIIAEEINVSNSCPLTSLNVKKRLAFDITDRRCSLSPSVFSGVKKLKNIDSDTRIMTSNKFVGHNKSSEIVHTSSSPFKVTLNKSIELSNTNTSTSSAVNNSVLDYLQKMNRTICNIKYDLNMVSDKINNIEGMLLNDIKIGDQSKSHCEDTFQIEFNNLLPLETEENLQTFENKLSNNEFRAKMVEEIKRYSRNTLPSTVRAIMRVIFKDTLLEEYSYKGIGNKKVFTHWQHVLLYLAVKKMKKFSKFDTIDVENPLRIFIAGAKFRDSARKNQNPGTVLLDNASTNIL
ncbi:hypothetical protein ACI65C_006611 [Semiaphis heraclei]